MGARIEFAFTLYIIYCLILGQHIFAQVTEGVIKFYSSADLFPSKSMVREPRETFFAKIIEGKPQPGVTPATDKAENAEDYSGYSYSESVSVSAESGSSSTSEEYEESMVLGSIVTTTSDPLAQRTSVSPEQKRLQLLAKVQQGRLIKPRESAKSHNWYTYKNHPRSRSVDSLTDSSDDEGWNSNLVPEVVDDLITGNYGGKAGSMNNGGGTNGGGTGSSPGNGNGGGGGAGPAPSGGGGSAGGGGTPGVKKPYNVMRARPSEMVDIESYNFFQFKPYSKLGWLWITRSKKLKMDGRSISIGDRSSSEDDDLDPSNKYDWEHRRYDRACLYVEYKKQKADAPIPLIQEELKRVVDNQNEQLARRFLDWQFIDKESHETIALQDKGDDHPLHLTYKFLSLTMEIFRDKICRNASSYSLAVAAYAPPAAITRSLATANTVETKLLPKLFIEELFRLFLTIREITLTKNVPDYATQIDEDEILKDALEKCKADEENINWFSHSCGDQILSNDQPNNFACTPLVDYDYNSKVYDPILDGMWHMFNAVQAYCFKQFQVNIRLWHRYALIIANSYTVSMRQRWKASTASQKFYMRLLGPDHEVHLETMNRCMFGTVLRSDVPAVIPRFDSPSTITFGKERIIHKDGNVGSS